jgi:hypothetical protein
MEEPLLPGLIERAPVGQAPAISFPAFFRARPILSENGTAISTSYPLPEKARPGSSPFLALSLTQMPHLMHLPGSYTIYSWSVDFLTGFLSPKPNLLWDAPYFPASIPQPASDRFEAFAMHAPGGFPYSLAGGKSAMP